MRRPFTLLTGRQSAGIDRMVVVVPARNEAERLPRCLESLAAARCHVDVDVEVVVVLDSCTDDSAARVGAADRVVAVDVGNVGAARAAGFDAVRTANHTWLMCTDADCEVPADWFTSHLGLARAGARVACGTVRVDNWTHLNEQTRARYLSGYRFDDDHRHVHGANLGIHSAEYWAVGGFGALTTGEDVDLVARLAERGPITWSSAAPVITSGRLEGRAPDGFAAHLQQLHAMEAG